MKKIVNFLPAIVIFCIIFYFSSQTGEESNKLSDPIAFNFYSFLGVNTLHFFVLLIRKSAHVIEFVVLFCSIFYGFKSSFNFKLKTNCFTSLGLTYLCAVLDEVHQVFVPGRTGAFIDTLIDISGVVVLVLVILVVNKVKKNPPYRGK